MPSTLKRFPPFLLLAFALSPLACARRAPSPEAGAAPPVARAPAPPTEPLPPPPALRLPASVRPTHYALELTLVPSEDTFRGVIGIDLELSEPTRVLWLNGTDLQVEEAHLAAGGQVLPVRPVKGNEDFLGFLLDRPVGPGKARLTVAWRGALDKVRSRGLYRQNEGDDWYVYSFFEPIDARRAFPCFDEPGFKVPWQLTFHVRKEHVALANAPVVSEVVEGAMKTVTLADSLPLSSYQVALVVGPFDVVGAGTAGHHGTPLRFIVPRGRGGETAYAARVTPRIVSLLEDYFGMPYPYRKLDVAVVPRFWGTMEHPGIVALGQPLTLIKPGEETVKRRQYYAGIAIHELAHYWFGDYVTMAWWNDTWLNEALASWLDQKVIDQLEPSWEYVLDRARLGDAMEADALVTAKKIRQPVESRHDIEGSFDNEITYFKGSAVLGMFEHWLGPERFQRFIRRYLAEHAWGNATSEDFLAALGAEAGPEAAAAFRTFIDQPGLPRVTAELQCPRGAPPRLVLSQERFVPAGSRGAEAQTWQLPVCVRYVADGRSRSACTLLTTPRAEQGLDAKQCPGLLLLNADGAGYYRAGYRPGELPKLFASRALNPAERVVLLADVRAAIERGDLPLGDALALVPALRADPDRHLFLGTLGLLHAVRMGQLSDESLPRYRRFIREMYGERARAIGWTAKPGEAEQVRLLRPPLLELAASVGEDPALVADARTLAGRWLADRGALDPDLVSPVLRVAAQHGDRALFERYLAEARRTRDRLERGQLLQAMGELRDPEASKAALALLLSDEFDLRESLAILKTALVNRESRGRAWDFLLAHFDELSAKMRSDEVLLMFRPLDDAWCDAPHRAQTAEFFSSRVGRFDGAPRVLANALERMDLCIADQRRNGASLARFLARY